jgi:hypothetical protein
MPVHKGAPQLHIRDCKWIKLAQVRVLVWIDLIQPTVVRAVRGRNEGGGKEVGMEVRAWMEIFALFVVLLLMLFCLCKTH